MPELSAEQREFGRHAAWAMGHQRQDDRDARNPWEGREGECDYLRNSWDVGHRGKPYEDVLGGDEPASIFGPR